MFSKSQDFMSPSLMNRDYFQAHEKLPRKTIEEQNESSHDEYFLESEEVSKQQSEPNEFSDIFEYIEFVKRKCKKKLKNQLHYNY